MRWTLVAAAVAAAAALWSAPTAAAVELCSGMGGAVDPDGLCRVHVEDPAFILDAAFPVAYPDEPAVTDFITTTRAEFTDEARAPDARNLPHALEIKPLLDATETTRSVTFEVYQNVGGAHPNTWFKSFNYDLAQNRAITLDTLFATADPLDTIAPIVERDLTERLGVPDLVLPSAGRDPANYQNFSITPSHVVFHFDRGALLAGAAGAQTVQIPRSELPPLAI